MNTQKKRLLAAVTVLAIATPAIAQDVGPPVAMTAEAIGAWIQAAKIAETTKSPEAAWNLATADKDGVVYFALDPKGADGIAKVYVRRERFAVTGGVRSEVKMYDLDCGKSLIKVTTEAAYAQHNFGGAKTDRPAAGAWGPVTADPLVADLQKEACMGAVLPQVDSVTVAANVPKTAKDAQAWIKTNNIRDKNVNGKDWSFLSMANIGLLYARVDNTDNDTRTANMHIRLERWNPDPQTRGLAYTETYEVNCRSNQLRKISASNFADHNLGGKEDRVGASDPWTKISDNALLKDFGTNMCKDFDVKRTMQMKAR